MKSIAFVILMVAFLASSASFGEESSHVAMPVDALHGQSKTAPNSGGTVKVTIEKTAGPNAITVAEAFRKSAALDKKKVVVRGKIVKIAKGIMKRNWIHIQDGTGSAARKTDTLVCTSKEMPTMGETVTVRGVLAKDRDFGSGYRYAAILENATFK